MEKNPYDLIHLKYQFEALKAVQLRYTELNKTNINILKTDAYNEAFNYYPIATLFPATSIVCLEVNQDTVEKAKANYPDLGVMEGDVKYIPFPPEYFDVVMDFSTIDHVVDFTKVVDSYKRVLKSDGILLLVVWTGENEWSDRRIKDSWGGDQIYFDYDRFKAYLSKRFDIIRESLFDETFALGDVSPNQKLRLFLCR